MSKMDSNLPTVKPADDRLEQILEAEAKLLEHERKMARLRAEFRRQVRRARRLTRKQDKQLRRAWFPEDFQRILRAAPVHNRAPARCSQVVTKKIIRRAAPRSRRTGRSLRARAGPSADGDGGGDGDGDPAAAIGRLKRTRAWALLPWFERERVIRLLEETRGLEPLLRFAAAGLVEEIFADAALARGEDP
jgi:hypothetical protein